MANRVTRTDILNWVRNDVWSGQYDEEEIALRIKDHVDGEDDWDEDWLCNVIHDEVEIKRKDEETWPKVTDFDRLDRAFTILEAQGVIALHRAGFTLSDGVEDVVEASHDPGGSSGCKRFCFYTEQDQEGALDGSGLYIAFGHLSDNEAMGVKVGQMVRAALESEGFNVEWDGTFKMRLFIKNFRYQRRSPR